MQTGNVKNTTMEHYKYVVYQKLGHFDDVRFGELS
jgi:hypothetical protein